MKKRTPTVITIDPATHTATITAADTFEIKHYTKAAEVRPHWRLVSAETNKKGKFTRIQYILPADDLRLKQPISESELQRMRESMIHARKHQRRHENSC